MQRIWGTTVAVVTTALLLGGCTSHKASTVPTYTATSRPSISASSSTSVKPAAVNVTKMTGPQVAMAAAAAMRAAGSVHVEGVGSMFGPTKSALKMDLAPGSGSVVISGATGAAHIIRVGGKTYIKASTAFWVSLGHLTSAIASRLADKWIIAPAAVAAATRVFTMEGFSDAIGHLSKGATWVNKTTTTTFRGTKVIVLKESDGSILYVAATGAPLPLYSLGRAAGSGDEFALTNYGKKIAITAPNGAIEAADSLKR